MNSSSGVVCLIYFCHLLVGSYSYVTFVRGLILNVYDEDCLTEEFRRDTQLFVSYKKNLFDIKTEQYLRFTSSTTTGIQITIKVFDRDGKQLFHENPFDRMDDYSWFDFQTDANFTVCASVPEYTEIFDDIRGRVDVVFTSFANLVEYKEARAKIALEDNLLETSLSDADTFVNKFVINW